MVSGQHSDLSDLDMHVWCVDVDEAVQFAT